MNIFFPFPKTVKGSLVFQDLRGWLGQCFNKGFSREDFRSQDSHVLRIVLLIVCCKAERGFLTVKVLCLGDQLIHVILDVCVFYHDEGCEQGCGIVKRKT